MINHSAAEHLEKLAVLSEYMGENPFRARAFCAAAEEIMRLDRDLEGALAEVPSPLHGVGAAIRDIIKEFIAAGTSSAYASLAASAPPGIFEMLGITGIGIKKLRALCEGLSVGTLDGLEEAARLGRVSSLKGFSKKSEAAILSEISRIREAKRQRLYPDALRAFGSLREAAATTGKFLSFAPAGELARRLPSMATISAVAVTRQGIRPDQALRETLDAIARLMSCGGAASPAFVSSPGGGIAAAIFELAPGAVNASIFAVSGAPEFTERVSWLLSCSNDYIAYLHASRSGEDEPCGELTAEDRLAMVDELASSLGGDVSVPPELTEIAWKERPEALAKGRSLLGTGDLAGTFHVHTTWSDGLDDIEAMISAAKAGGLTYLGIADHSKSSFYANGLSEERVARQLERIAEANLRHAPFRIFAGVECDILRDGTLDYSSEVLSRFDYIVVSVHSGFKSGKAEMTERIVRAVSQPYPIMLGHMTGRLLNARAGYEVDHEAVFAAAKANSAIIELNCNPHRMDVDFRHLPTLARLGVMVSINPDAHCAADVCGHLGYGIDAANLGGASREDIFNCRTADAAAEFFASRKLQTKG